MKFHLFLSVVSVFAVFHLCKAGPLRHLEKRAAFYIANETACVVDNIVYSNGDPIPTDDPCEACRCRPPGFACVLKECKIKPGCRAVRHAGECCPEYVCGCEHNGRFYKDGDEIKDPKNPCYQCYCQGSSIACAFVDCIYRDECDSVFVPGECCPKYANCTKDIPDRNLFIGGNALPPVNLLPAFNDESILLEVSSTDPIIELPENPANPIQPQESSDNAEKAVSVESSESEDDSSKPETAESESLETEAKNVNTEVEEKDIEPLESSNEEKQNLPKETEEKEAVESIEETKVLLNSESDVNKDDATDSEAQESDLKLSTEAEKELPQTTVASESKENIKEPEVTEKPLETESTSTEITERDSQIKNSASENSKSLKLSDNDQLEEIEKKEQNVKSDEETTTVLVPESTSAVPTSDLKESSTMESKPQSTENVAEESQTNPQATPFNINNAKIKSESAETVTIVVHVKESQKLSTETVTPVSVSSVTEENLLKSNDEIGSTNNSKESSDPQDNKSTSTNFEIFPTSKETSEIELASKSPSVEQNSEDVQGRSDEADNIALEAKENPVSEDKVSDSKSEDVSSVITTMSAVEVNKETRTDEEVTEKTKVDDSASTVIRIDTSRPITIQIITDSTSSPKPENSVTESENEKTEELTEEKELKTEKTAEETSPEVREDAAKPEEKVEETTPIQSTEELIIKEQKSPQVEKTESTTEKGESILEEKVQESTTANIADKPEIRTNDEIEKNEEKTDTEHIVDRTTEESKSEGTTESQKQGTEEPRPTTLSDNL